MAKELKFVLYSRIDCHLCEQMQDELAQFMAATAYILEIVDIDHNPELQKKYGGRIPVLTYDDDILCEYFFHSNLLKNLLS